MKYKVLYLGSNFSAEEADTLTNAINALVASGWIVVSSGANHVILKQEA